jgi:hypothetical protein
VTTERGQHTGVIAGTDDGARVMRRQECAQTRRDVHGGPEVEVDVVGLVQGEANSQGDLALGVDGDDP